MKTLLYAFVCLLFSFGSLQAQKVTILHIDTKGVSYDPIQMGNLTRIELDKLQKFEITDKYDVMYLIRKDSLNIDQCYGKICLVEIGKAIGAEKILTGNVERFNDVLFVNFRLIDVQSATIEKSFIKEYLYLSSELQRIVQVSLREMFGFDNDPDVLAKLTKKDTFDNQINNPYRDRLRLDGPRMGATYFTGNLATYLQEEKTQGGFDAVPVMFQFGYQFETQYLNEGDFQALFEFIPMVTGIDQGLFIPSFTILNGLRSNKTGWEFAFGPTLSLVSEAEGYFSNGQWIRKTDATDPSIPLEKRIDSRGDLAFRSGFVIAAGKSFRSGKLNIPVNLYFIPSKEGHRFGVSFGFNAKN